MFTAVKSNFRDSRDEYFQSLLKILICLLQIVNATMSYFFLLQTLNEGNWKRIVQEY